MKFKKYFIAAILGLATVFSGCSEKDAERPDLNYDCSFTAQVISGEEVFEAKAKKSAQSWSFTYTSPAQLEGMEVLISDGTVTVNYNGLTQTSDRESVPSSNICDFTARAYEFIANGKSIEFTNEDGKTVGKGVFDGGDMKVEFSNKNVPKRITIGNDIEISIKEFKKQQQ